MIDATVTKVGYFYCNQLRIENQNNKITDSDER